MENHIDIFYCLLIMVGTINALPKLIKEILKIELMINVVSFFLNTFTIEHIML
jgi:hypothetical protein